MITACEKIIYRKQIFKEIMKVTSLKIYDKNVEWKHVKEKSKQVLKWKLKQTVKIKFDRKIKTNLEKSKQDKIFLVKLDFKKSKQILKE